MSPVAERSTGLLTGKVAVILGAGPNLGRAIATRFAAEGADLLLVARDPRSLDEIARHCAPFPGRVVAHQGDITAAGDRDQIRVVAEESFGRVDVLVGSASTTGSTMDIADADIDTWREVMDVNVWAPIAVVQRLMPLLRAADQAAVVMISAMTTRMVSARGRAGYAMSKAALNQAVRSMAYEFGRDGIRVNAVLPGWIAGPTTDAWLADPATEDIVHRAVAAIPLSRLPSTDDVAGSVAYLASELSRSVTGVLLDTNGGQYMNN